MAFTGSVAGQSLTPYLQGSVTTTTTAPTGNTALYFPGVTGSYLNLGTNSPVHFSTATSNLFVETWVNFSQNAFTEYIAGTLYSTTTDDWGFRVDGTFNRFMFYHYNTSGVSTAVTAPSGTPVIQGTWYHVAASFVTTGTNGRIYLYVNGVLQNAGGTSIGGTPRYTAAASAFIGTPSPLPGGWVATNAYMKDIRIIKGGILPVTGFTPAPTPWYYNTNPSYVTGGTVVFGLYGQYIGNVSAFSSTNPRPSLAVRFEGTTADYAGGTQPTNTGTLNYVPGKYKTALQIVNAVAASGATAATSYVTYPFSLSSGTGFSVLTWALIDAIQTATQGGVVGLHGNPVSAPAVTNYFNVWQRSNGGTWGFFAHNGAINEADYAPSLSSGVTPVNGTWYHLALTVSSTTFTLYVNGSQTNTAVVGNAFTVDNIYLGTSGQVRTQGLIGTVDDFRVYTSVLSATQIQSIYNQQGMPSIGVLGVA